MKKTASSFYICALFLLFISCSDSSSVSVIQNCEKQLQIIDEPTYNMVNTSNYTITGVAINRDCLDVTLSSSGCDAINWRMSLFSTNNFPNTTPIQRSVKVELVNNEACAAVLSKTVSFDLTPLRVAAQGQVIVNIDGWATPVTYNY